MGLEIALTEEGREGGGREEKECKRVRGNLRGQEKKKERGDIPCFYEETG